MKNKVAATVVTVCIAAAAMQLVHNTSSDIQHDEIKTEGGHKPEAGIHKSQGAFVQNLFGEDKFARENEETAQLLKDKTRPVYNAEVARIQMNESDVTLKQSFDSSEFSQALFNSLLAARHQSEFSHWQEIFGPVNEEYALRFRAHSSEVVTASERALARIDIGSFSIEAALLVGTVASLQTDTEKLQALCEETLSRFPAIRAAAVEDVQTATSSEDLKTAFLSVFQSELSSIKDVDEALRTVNSLFSTQTDKDLRQGIISLVLQQFPGSPSVLDMAREYGLSTGSNRTTSL